MSRKAKSIIGNRYGKLIVLKRDFLTNKGGPWWFCKCDCGNIKSVRGSRLKSGTTKSCGCYQIETTIQRSKTHGMSKTKTYKSWSGAKRRCYNKNTSDYVYYGGRGITVCSRWLNSFENFLEDMGKTPDKKTLDRIDSNKNYCKKNCRWATVKQQNRNKNNNHLVDGICAAQYAEDNNLNYNTLISRLNT